jgi:hypothetical protein
MQTVASTDERFRDFAPYVPSIDDAGVVAFQAAIAAGATGVFTSTGLTALDAGPYTSHPAIDADGRAIAVYAEDRLVVIDERGRPRPIATGYAVGPLGPTMKRGAIAFRATRDGRAGVFLARGDEPVETIADTSRFAAFHGLPVVTARGTVVFRAELTEGGHGIFASRDGRIEPVVLRAGELGLFPSANDDDTVAFADGHSAFVARSGATHAIDTPGLEHARGALVDGEGRVVVIGTRAGRLGVFRGADTVVAIGDAWGNSTVTELALNPVSINARGQLAIRLRLSDDRQLVVIV